jgi:hypothetical protein
MIFAYSGHCWHEARFRTVFIDLTDFYTRRPNSASPKLASAQATNGAGTTAATGGSWEKRERELGQKAEQILSESADISRYLPAMSSITLALVEAFEALPPEEKQAFANAIFRRLPPIDSGPLEDEEVAAAGDALAAMLTQEENATPAR